VTAPSDDAPTVPDPPARRVTVRVAHPTDASAVAALLADGAVTNREDPSDPAPYARALATIGGTAGNDVLVAEVDGSVVGVLQLLVFRHIQQQGGTCAEIESVHVATGQRSGGIGAALVADAVERARRAGAYRVQLTSNKVRSDAHRFWERQGFERTHEGFKRLLGGP
jgi:GNAT superfamily N-acetyltransferase